MSEFPNIPTTVPSEDKMMYEKNMLKHKVIHNLTHAIGHLKQAHYLSSNLASLNDLENLLDFVQNNEDRFIEICNDQNVEKIKSLRLAMINKFYINGDDNFIAVSNYLEDLLRILENLPEDKVPIY